MYPATGALAYNFLDWLESPIPTQGRISSMETAPHRADQTRQRDLPVNDVQCPLVDIERGFFDGFAQGGVGMSGAPDVFGAAAEFDH